MDKNSITARAELLIRKPVGEVFEAFVNPEITTKFWFSSSTGRLESGAKVCWSWELFGVSDNVEVKSFEKDKKLLIEWGSDDKPTTFAEWVFTDRPDNTTIVSITNYGFSGDQHEIYAQAIDATEGFTLVLCNLKALLEHAIDLQLISDRFPDSHP